VFLPLFLPTFGLSLIRSYPSTAPKCAAIPEAAAICQLASSAPTFVLTAGLELLPCHVAEEVAFLDAVAVQGVVAKKNLHKFLLLNF